MSAKPDRGSKSAADLVKLAFGHVASKALGFIAFAWLARVLSPSDYGILEAVVGMSVLGFICIEFATGTIGIRRIAGDKASDRDTLGAVLGGRLLMACLCIPVLVTAYAWVLGPNDAGMLVVLFGFSLFAVVVRSDWLFIAHDRLGIAAGGNALKMGVFLTVILVLPPAAHGIIIVGWAECLAMAAMAAFFYAMRPPGLQGHAFRPNLTHGRLLLRESFSLGVAGLLASMLLSLPVVIVVSTASPAQGGELAAALRIIVAITAFSVLYYQALLPIVLSKRRVSDQAAQDIVEASDTLTAWSACLLALLFYVIADPLISLIYGNKIAGASSTFALLVWALPIYLAVGSANLVLVAQHRQRGVLIAQGAGLSVTLSGAAYGATQSGADGAAVAILLGYLLVWAIAQWFSRACSIRSKVLNTAVPLVLTAGIAYSQTVDIDLWAETSVWGLALLISAAHMSKLWTSVSVLLTCKDDAAQSAPA